MRHIIDRYIYLQIDEMGVITIVNNTSEVIHVSVTKVDDGGEERFYSLSAYGGSDTWGRSNLQTIRFIRSKTPGVLVETILGVPDQTVNIY